MLQLTAGPEGRLTSPHQVNRSAYRPDEAPLSDPGLALARLVTELYAFTHGDRSLPLDRMIDQLRGEFKTHKAIHGRSPFVLVSMPGKPEDQEAWLRVLAEVKKRLEHVILIEISDSSEAHTLEGFLFMCLNTRLASEKRSRIGVRSEEPHRGT